MSQRRRSYTQGRWRALALSVLLHSGIVAAAVYGWFTWKSRPPAPVTLAIEGTVVDERALKSPAPEPAPEPAPPEPTPQPEPEPEPEPIEEQGPPKPDPAEIERKKEEERLAQEDLEKKKEAEEKKRLEAEKAAAEKAAAEKKAAEKKKADEAAAARKAAEEKARLAQQAELRRAMEAEERGNAVRNSDAAARWYASIVAKIERAWKRPDSARPGVTCIVAVNQVPGGEVTSVQVRSCSINDAALRQSVENAVYNASPLPAPPDPALFERNLELTFAPK